MSRGLSTTNASHVEGSHVHEIVMVKLEFDTPVYVHSGIGTVSFDGNDYLGVGDFGGVGESRESQSLGPAPIRLQLSGIDSTLLAEAMDAGTFGDKVTVYCGYRQDDGTLIDDPWIVAKGKLEYSSLTRGDDNTISIVAQHDLAVLNEADGSKFSDEDQRQRYSTDEGFEYVEENAVIKLLWGGKPHNSGGNDYDGTGPDPNWWDDI